MIIVKFSKDQHKSEQKCSGTSDYRWLAKEQFPILAGTKLKILYCKGDEIIEQAYTVLL